MTPHRGNIIPLSVSPSNGFVSEPRTLEGLLEQTWRPSRFLNLASCVASGTAGIQGHHQVCCTGQRKSKVLVMFQKLGENRSRVEFMGHSERI